MQNGHGDTPMDGVSAWPICMITGGRTAVGGTGLPRTVLAVRPV